MRRPALGLAGALAAIALLLFATDLPGRPGRLTAPDGVPVLVVDHGYHAGLILPRKRLAERARALGLTRLQAVVARFVAYDQVEMGWGDEGFYRTVPGLSALTLPQALRALFGFDNPSVVHVVGIPGAPAAYFAMSDMVRLQVDAAGFDRLAAGIEATLAPAAGGTMAELGPGLYGPSLFFRADGAYHLTHNCNHWIARLVNAAGVPVSLLTATVSAALMADLRMRGGATPP